MICILIKFRIAHHVNKRMQWEKQLDGQEMEKCKYCGHVGGGSGIVRKKQQYKSLECRHTMCEIDSQTKKEKLQLHYILRGMDFEELREF